jgi:hypothetical protein
MLAWVGTCDAIFADVVRVVDVVALRGTSRNNRRSGGVECGMR